MKHFVTPLLLVGGWGRSGVEQVLRQAHQAATRDLVDTLLDTGLVKEIVIATDSNEWTETFARLPVTVDIDTAQRPFHFGQRLAELIVRYDVQRVLYLGGGSAPLLCAGDWRKALSQLAEAERLVITNNLHSSDWVGFTPAVEALATVAQQECDNALAWALVHDLGWPAESSPPTAATRFDLDTPTDLLIARFHPRVGPHLHQYLNKVNWDTSRIEQVLAVMATEGSTLLVAGRTSSAVWASLEQATQCWVRVYAEERGMRASGRQAHRQVRSLLADYLERVGIEDFFAELTQLGEGVLLDSRVLFAAHGISPSPPDRFYSDLLEWRYIHDPFVREFTRAAAEARLPILLGGHSVVAGGLMALVEILQAQREQS